jgi:hypothetical protein
MRIEIRWSWHFEKMAQTNVSQSKIKEKMKIAQTDQTVTKRFAYVNQFSR